MNLFSQIFDKNYMIFSDHKSSEWLVFKNDSILFTKPIFRGGIYFAEHYKEVEYYYKKTNDTITIINFEPNKNVNYKIFDSYLENSNRREIIFLRSNFEMFPDVAFKFKNKIYWQDSPVTSAGIIRESGKPNKKLNRLFKKLSKLDFEVKFYSGYDAFEIFGIEYVFGIYEIKLK